MNAVERKATFRDDGFLIMRGFFSPAECERLFADIRDAQKQASTSRLDKSGLAFRHNLYRLSAPLRGFVAQPKLVHLLRDVIGPSFWVRWDQTVEKTPGGAEFPWHQDNGYNGLMDGHFQFWVSLSEMTPQNGGLWLQRGSHRHGRMPHERVGNHLVCKGNEADAVFIPAAVGDAVLFSSFLLHRTSPNVTDTSRLAYVIEYMSSAHFDPYIPAPYFQVARGGESDPRWVHLYSGRLNPINQFKYLPSRVSRGAVALRSRLGWLLRGGKPAVTS